MISLNLLLLSATVCLSAYVEHESSTTRSTALLEAAPPSPMRQQQLPTRGPPAPTLMRGPRRKQFRYVREQPPPTTTIAQVNTAQSRPANLDSSISAGKALGDDEAVDAGESNQAEERPLVQIVPETAESKAEVDEQPATMMISGRRPEITHIIHMPNGQSFQFCDESAPGKLKCNDENAVCTLGACVCKPNFFQNRKLGLCQSISDLFKNCENDHQCQAFSVDMICDNSSSLHERPFCNCPSGLYFDEQTHTCVSCVIKKPGDGSADCSLAHSTKTILSISAEGARLVTVDDQEQQQDLGIKKADKHLTTKFPQIADEQLRRLQQRLQSLSFGSNPPASVNLDHLMPQRVDLLPFSRLSTLPASGDSPRPSSTTSSSSSSVDPFRIKTPLEVVISAIMLFTLLTVAWFFLQRMVHDCRAILRSLRNPAEFNATSASGELGVNGAADLGLTFGGRAVPHQYALDPAGQAVARLFSADPHHQNAMYQRDLAGVMVQHLAANLSPSSTSQALMAVANGRVPLSSTTGANEYDASLYPVTAGDRQSRNAAATAAAAQFLLSPSHPAIAILRAAAAAAQSNPASPDYRQSGANHLLTMFDPPPKYEEAIAQQVPNYIYYPTMPMPPPSNQSAGQVIGSLTPPARDSCPQAIEDRGDGEARSTENLTGSREFDATPDSPSVYIQQDTNPAEDSVAVADGNEFSPSMHSPPGVDPPSTQNQQQRPNHVNPGCNGRRANRRSRRDRNSMSRGQQRHQQQNQDSDDTLTEV